MSPESAFLLVASAMFYGILGTLTAAAAAKDAKDPPLGLVALIFLLWPIMAPIFLFVDAFWRDDK